MLLYLKGETEQRVYKIELIDGCFPKITCADDGSHSPPPNEKLGLEPAIWGMILLLDRIYVDFGDGRRSFGWTTKEKSEINDNEDALNHDASFRYMCVEDQCYDYNDDVDELFNLAQELIKISELQTGMSKITADYLNSIKEEQHSLIRLLYCYIFPKVIMYKKDLPKVQEAITKQICYIQKIDKDILRDSEILQKLNEVLQNQQDQRAEQFEDLAETKKCTKKFLMILDEDLNKRIIMLNEKLDESQTVVNAIKTDISANGKTTEKAKQLDEARRESAKCHQILQRLLLLSRDTIKTALSENGFLEKDSEEIVLDYLKSTEMSIKQKIVASNQTDKKVFATSILQNLLLIKQEIETKGVAYSSSGQGETNVMKLMKSNFDIHCPEYQTLSQRVTDIVNNAEHPLGEQFQNCVVAIQERCQSILDITEVTTGQKRKKNAKEIGNYLVVGNDGTIQEEFLSILEDLSRRIKEHFRAMATSFQEHFSSGKRIKLQLCYEDNFYSRVGEDIMKVYHMAHEHHRQQMVVKLEGLAILPINCLDLDMKDEWWLELFEKRRKVMLSSRYSSAENVVEGGTSLRCGKSLESDSSSGSSSGSSIEQAAPKDGQLRGRKRTPSRIRRSVLSIINRLSREVSRSSLVVPQADEISNGDDQGIPNSAHNDLDNSTDDSLSDSWVPCHADNNEVNGHPPLQIPRADVYQAEVRKFEEYFGPSLQCLKNVFKVHSVFAKLQCLTESLRKVTQSVEELRRQALQKSDIDEDSLAITGDQLLPLIVLVILQMDPGDAAALQGQLKMMQDLIPDFLSAGCYCWAMTVFHMACQVVLTLCNEFDWTDSFGSMSSVGAKSC